MARTSPSVASRRRRHAEAKEPRPRPVQIAVAMPRSLLRELLLRRLDKEPELELVASAETASAVADMVQRHQPRVLLLDEDLHGSRSERFLGQLRGAARNTRVLLLSSRPSDALLEATLRGGGAGIVPTQGDYSMLLRAIRAVSRGELWANRRLIARALERAYDPESPATLGSVLSEKEREIADLVGRGLRNKEIARRLGIVEKTVKNHLSNIFRKLKVDNRFAVGLYSLDIRPRP
jgi:DNA-binding NarL/FixJ family response regulator